MTKPAKNVQVDFWAPCLLSAWKDNPEKTFQVWLAQKRVIQRRGMRKTSCETYTTMFNVWLKALNESHTALLEATPHDARRFFEQHTLEPVSRRRYLQLLDKVYYHLQQHGWGEINPLREELKRERELQIPLPPGLSFEEEARLIDYLTGIPGWKGLRDRAMAAVCLGAGLRTNELMVLQFEQINVSYQVRVTSSSVHREHTSLILPDGPWREWYLEWKATQGTLSYQLVCPSTRGGKVYSASGIFRRINSWLEETEIQSAQQGANLLRNTFARSALSCKRYNLEQVQEFLGHEESRATARHLAAMSADDQDFLLELA